MSHSPYLLLETPNTPRGHRFLVAAGVLVDSAQAAAVCSKMPSEGAFQGDAWLGVAARQVQESLDAGRVGLARTALVGIHVARLSPSEREEIFDQLRRVLEELPRITAEVDWEQSGGRLVVASDRVTSVVDLAWQSLPRLAFGSRSAPRHSVRRVILVVTAVVVVAWIGWQARLGTTWSKWVALYHEPVPTETSLPSLKAPPPMLRTDTKAVAEVDPSKHAKARPDRRPREVQPPRPEPARIELSAVVRNDMAASSPQFTVTEAKPRLDRLTEIVAGNQLLVADDKGIHQLAGCLLAEARGESGIREAVAAVQARSSDLPDRRLTPAFEQVWRELRAALVGQVTAEIAEATREFNLSAIDTAADGLPIQLSLSRITADNDSVNWPLVEDADKALIERRRREGLSWLEKSKSLVEIEFKIAPDRDPQELLNRDRSFMTIYLVSANGPRDVRQTRKPLKFRGNKVAVPAAYFFQAGAPRIECSYFARSGKIERQTVPLSRLLSREANDDGDVQISIVSPVPAPPEWLRSSPAEPPDSPDAPTSLDASSSEEPMPDSDRPRRERR